MVSRTLVFLALLSAAPAAHGLDWAGKVQQDTRDLQSPDVKVRLGALTRLGQYRHRDIAPLILRALSDSDTRVQRLAATLAADRKITAAVPVLVGWLSHWDTGMRLSAAESLGRIGAPRAARNLVRALVDPELKVRLEVIKALGALSTPDNLEIVPLLGRLQDTNSKVRRAAVEVLASKHDHRAVIPLMGRIEDSAREVRIAAIDALGELGDAKAGPALVRLLRDPSFEVAAAAIKTLGRLRYTGATEPLVDLFRSGAATHRRRAAAALARLHTDLAIRALVEGLANPSLRSAAKNALVTVGADAADALTDLLRDPRSPRAVATAAVEIARDARLGKAVPAIVEQIQLGRLPLPLLIESLGEIGDPRAQRPLLDLVQHPSLEVRLAALHALRGIVDERAAEPLVNLLRDRSRRLRLVVIDYLGRLGSRLAVPRLIELARSSDRAVAREAVHALSRCRDERAVPVLIRLLSHNDRSLRRMSAQALARIAAPAAVAPLLQLCRDSLGSVRVVCLQALGGVLRGKTNERALSFIKGLLGGKDRSVFLAATDALAAMRDPRIQELLIERYPKLDPLMARKVVEVLGNDPSQAARVGPFLLDVLDSDDNQLRSAAAWSLGKLAGGAGLTKGVAQRLMAAARDPDWIVRTNATASLARMRLPGARALLRMLVETDQVAYVRANAILGLGLIGGDAAGTAPLLVSRLFNDRSPWVRINALRSLRRLGPAVVRSTDGRRWRGVEQVIRTVVSEDLDMRVRKLARQMLKPRDGSGGSWVGLFLLDQARRPLRSALVALITPSGLVRGAVSDPRAELWEENLSDGVCFAELPPPSVVPSEN